MGNVITQKLINVTMIHKTEHNNIDKHITKFNNNNNIIKSLNGDYNQIYCFLIHKSCNSQSHN